MASKKPSKKNKATQAQKADATYDKKNKIKAGSKADKAIDKKKGLKY